MPVTVENLKKEHSGVGKLFCTLLLNIFHAWYLSCLGDRYSVRDVTSALSLDSAPSGTRQGTGPLWFSAVVLHCPGAWRLIEDTAQTPTLLIYQAEYLGIL